MKRAAFVLLTIWVASIFLAAQSQPESDNEPLDMKSYTCAVHFDLIELEDGRSDIVTVWAHGYYNGMRGVDEKAAPESWISVEAFSGQLLKVCQSDPEALFIHAVKQTAQAKPEASRP
ncbi:MAG: HdeA/HdeB family chaperone [Bryobacterales bacterium]